MYLISKVMDKLFSNNNKAAEQMLLLLKSQCVNSLEEAQYLEKTS